jgi:hypothetical protein
MDKKTISDTVLILGAGASFDAGIPLLSNFVQTMWEIAIRSKYNDILLTPDDKEIFQNAIKVRNELDAYHGRANFNDRNIEDILSILSFNLFEDKKIDRDRMDWIIKAIVRTIELTCNVKHSGEFSRIEEDGIRIYRNFWMSLFKNYKETGKFPTIITFNYDLVLERSLFQVLNSTYYNSYDNKVPFSKFSIKYHYKFLPMKTYQVKYTSFAMSDFKNKQGVVLLNAEENNDNALDINILKLHGSVNFPNKKSDISSFNIAKPTLNPLIMPPIFNKMQNSSINEIWKVALDKLRNAINICIIGYSMPQTDIYMNYFLKSALGPNINLNKIFVFNPVFNQNNECSSQMKNRYQDCFSPQLHERIYYNPIVYSEKIQPGTFKHFTELLNTHPGDIIFR